MRDKRSLGRALLDSAWMRAASKSVALNAYLAEKSLTAGIVPWMQSLAQINSDVSSGLRDVLLGARPAQEVARELGGRLWSAARYGHLVTTHGRELFGSARFAGEELLVEGDVLRLSFLPAAQDVEGPGFALFHAGGFIPFGDRLFRFLPEANLFAPYLARGVPVYLVEVDPTRAPGHLGRVTLSWLIDELDRLAEVAFAHRQHGQRMVIEGYCGLALPMLAYLAAKPREARRKFDVAVTMVAPIDGRACAALSELARLIPEPMHSSTRRVADVMGQVLGEQIRVGIDIALGTAFSKSPLGRFAEGWKRPEAFARGGAEPLDAAQRKELAGAYWISPDNSRRCPLPPEVMEASLRLFTAGLADDLVLPVSYRGSPLSLQTIVEQTDIQLVGFYGARDPVVPPATADVLVRAMGERYTRVVHPKAGHISYVLSPELWDPRHRAALSPPPIEAMVQAKGRVSA